MGPDAREIRMAGKWELKGEAPADRTPSFPGGRSSLRGIPTASFLALFLVAGLAPGASPAPGAMASPETNGLEEVLSRYVSDAGWAVGAVAALVTPEGVEVASAGRTRGRRSGPPDRETLFEVGSITKVFTTLLLAQMADEGVVRLDSTLGELFPEGYEPDPVVAGITLLELATHTSGLPRVHGGVTPLMRFILRPSDPYRGTPTEELFRSVADLTDEDLATRGSPAYSNLGMALLGRLLEEEAGRSWEELLEDRILTPRELGRTGLTSDLMDDPHFARGHRRNHRPAANWILDGYAPAGAMASTLDDMVRFLLAVMEAEEGPLARTMEPAWDQADGSGAAGLGWAFGEVEGERVIWHNGRTGGYFAFLGFIPSSDRGLVLLTNTSHSGNSFALSHLAGAPGVPATAPDWIPILFTFGFVALAPMVLMGCRTRVASKQAGTGGPIPGRVHLLDNVVTAAFFLAVTWKAGTWNVPSGWLWWLGGGLTVLALIPVAAFWPRLPWAAPGRPVRTGLTVVSALFFGMAVVWTVLRL
jgi:serine-type D-Ala-D-Ala carboxypeptidase/endopeptidase